MWTWFFYDFFLSFLADYQMVAWQIMHFIRCFISWFRSRFC